MSLEIKPLPDCCWAYLSGITSEGNPQEIKRFFVDKTGVGSSKDWTFSLVFYPNALLMCVAYGYAAYWDDWPHHITKKKALDRLELYCTTLEPLAKEIIEIPGFENTHHESTILSRIVKFDQSLLQAVITDWRKEIYPKANNPLTWKFKTSS